MYLPPRFLEEDPAVLREFVASHDFATLVTVAEGSFLVSHAPLVLDAGRGPGGSLLGHLARANPQAAHLGTGASALAVFMGPHAYISPAWYQNPTVPTWNYAVVYVEGISRHLDDRDDVVEILERTTRAHEGPSGWRFDPGTDQGRRLMERVQAFEIRIERLRGKFKLDQHEADVDREGVARGLLAIGDSGHAELARLMRAARSRPR